MADGRSGAAKVFNTDLALLLLRLLLGAVFIFHGGQKMFGWFEGKGWDETIKGFVGMGLPSWLAAFTIVTEFVGGCCIVLGLLARFWSAGTAIIMINAIALVHIHSGWDKSGKWLGFKALWTGNEFQLSLLAISLAIFFAGPGRWAVGDLEGWILGLRRGKGGSGEE